LFIGYRLFVAVLLAMLAVAAIGVGLVRWKLYAHFSADMPPELALRRAADQSKGLVDALSAAYRVQHDWSFLPADSVQRKTWLRDGLLRSQDGQEANFAAKRLPPTLAYRAGLLDRDKRYLAGVIAHPLTIAFASINTIRQAVVVDGEAVGFLVIAQGDDADEDLAVAFLIDQQDNLFLLVAIGVLLSALAAALLAANFRRPIGQLVDVARRLGDARFDTRLDIRRKDEFGELADTFNRLATKLEGAEQSRRQWIADTSHELRTPLSVLRAQMEGLQDGVRTATPDNIALMLRQVQMLTTLVDELYQLAQADVGQLHFDKRSNDAWQLVRDVFAGFAGKFRAAGLDVAIGAPPTRSIVQCDAARMCQVATNLFENCTRYTASGGRVEVSGNVIGDELRITIDDSAPGVPAPMLANLGERFFRVESSRNRQFGGAGLGLALSKHILEAQDGRLEFAASPLGGLRAIIMLKLEDAK
jgi:two-component system sensor histidine kinase BaeS